jgi:hypothetical protein
MPGWSALPVDREHPNYRWVALSNTRTWLRCRRRMGPR